MKRLLIIVFILSALFSNAQRTVIAKDTFPVVNGNSLPYTFITSKNDTFYLWSSNKNKWIYGGIVGSGGSGTVSSVGINFTNGTALTPGGPVTSNGNIPLTWSSDANHYVLGNGTLASRITSLSQLTNDGGFITLASLSATAPLQFNNSTGVFSIQQSNTSQSGYLSSTDWNTFNNKLPSTRRINTSFSVTGGSDLSSDLNLALVNDLASPGDSMYYGTNPSGIKGWYKLPTGTGGTGVTDFVSLNDVAVSSLANSDLFIWNGSTSKINNIHASTGYLKYSGGSFSFDNSVFLTANQSITFTAGGDISGSASGTTSISPSLTVTGLKGAALPALASGFLKYNGSAWAFDNSTYLTTETSLSKTISLNQGNGIQITGTASQALSANPSWTIKVDSFAFVTRGWYYKGIDSIAALITAPNFTGYVNAIAGENYLSKSGSTITANAVNVSGTNITGVLKASAFPTLTGDVTNTALATTVAWTHGYTTYDARYLQSYTETDPLYTANGVPKTRTLTINGTTLDLSANRSWTISTSSSLATLTDVTLTSLVNGQLIKYNSTSGKWENFTPNYLSSETDPTVDAIIKAIPVSADAATNKYLNWNGSAYVRSQIAYSQISGTPNLSGYLNSESDPTVDAIIKAIPITTDATTNKYYYWNNGSIARKQIAYSDIAGTPDLSGYQLISNLATSTSLGTSNTLYPSQLAVKTYVDNAIISAGGYTDSKAQDAVGGILSTEFTYTSHASIAINSIASTKITGTKTNTFISDFDTHARSLFSGTSPLSYNSSTGAFTLGTVGVANGGTGLTALGTANQLIRVNAGATALEYFTPSYLTSYTETDPLALKITNNLSDLNNAATARTNLGITGWASNLITTANPSAVRFIKINADNTVSLQSASSQLSALGGPFLTSETDPVFVAAFVHGITSVGAGLQLSSGVLSSTITQYSDASARAALSLTTTGTSGNASYNSTTGVFNIPNYTYALPTASTTVLGGVKVDGTTITINGSGVISAATGTINAYSQFTDGTNTSTASGSDIFKLQSANNLLGIVVSETTNDHATFTINQSNFVLAESQITNLTSDLSAKQTALSGTGFVKISGTTISYDNSTYLKTESDPVFAASAAAGILSSDIVHWNLGWNKFAVSGVYSAGTITFTDRDASTWAVTGLPTPTVISTSSSSITLSTSNYYVFTGTNATFTLPSSPTANKVYSIKNRGSGTLTVDGGGNEIYDTSTQSTYLLLPGDAVELGWDGAYWVTL